MHKLNMYLDIVDDIKMPNISASMKNLERDERDTWNTGIQPQRNIIIGLLLCNVTRSLRKTVA